MFGDEAYSDSEQQTASHPADAIRRSIAIGNIATEAANYWQGDYPQMAATAFTQSILATEAAFEKISGEDPSRRARSGLAKAMSPSEMLASEQLMTHLDSEMRERLKPFSYEN
jgi:hypothetical protein